MPKINTLWKILYSKKHTAILLSESIIDEKERVVIASVLYYRLSKFESETCFLH